MVQFHRDLARRAAADPIFQVHDVTARELDNLAKAAEAGWTGSVAEARDDPLVENDPVRRPRPAPSVSAETGAQDHHDGNDRGGAESPGGIAPPGFHGSGRASGQV